MNRAKSIKELSRDGRIEELAELLDQGADVNEKDESGFTPLHWAVQEELMDVTRLLLDHGANVDSREENGFTPLRIAVGQGHTQLIRLLLERGADVNGQVQSGSHDTLLHLACAWNRQDIANILIEYGANLEATDDDGRTPIFLAAMYGHTELVEQLIAKGAKVDVVDRVGKSLADLAKSGPDDIKIIQGTSYQIHINLPIEGLDPHNGSADIDVILDSGESYAATFFTLGNISQNFEKNKLTGDYKQGLYFWAPGMIVVEVLAEQVISETIADLTLRDEIQSALRKVRHDEDNE